jgi:hypothetical protein
MSKSATEFLAASQEFSFMLASPANQLTGAETTAADLKARTADILTLEFSGAQHESVLLSPGKWNIGAASTNQIELNHEGVAAHQFLIIVTEHRSVIKDWSGSALCNGSPFDSAVLGDGDIVEIADVQLAFRLAKSLDLISQLPYVAESGSADPISDEINVDIGVRQGETQNTVHVTADGTQSFEERGDRLDELIVRIESSLTEESSDTDSDEATGLSPEFHDPTCDVDSNSHVPLSDAAGEVASQPHVAESPLESQAGFIDDELLQLEKLRAAVQLDREQLQAKRALLVHQTREAESQLQIGWQEIESAVVNNSELSDGLNDADAFEIPTLEGAANSKSEGEAVSGDSSFSFVPEVANDVDSQVEDEDETVTAEREKLRQYVEEFDSVDDAESDVIANVTVGVGAVQAATEYTVMNALRSRDDAVRQLDELVLAATGGQELGPEGKPESSFGRPINLRGNATADPATSLTEFNRELETRDHDDGINVTDANVDAADTAGDLEASVEELGVLINEVDAEDTVVVNESATTGPLDADGSEYDESPYEFDLSALTAGIDGDVDSNDAAAGDAVVGIFEVVEDDNNSSTFESEIIEDCTVVDEVSDVEPSVEDHAEGILTLQRSDNDELIETWPVDRVGNTDPDIVADVSQSDVSSAQITLNEPYANPNTAETGPASELVPSELPSWFDSKFMAKGDSAVDDRISEGHSESDDKDTDAATSPAGGEPTVDVRQKLAEMFDLPALSENTGQVVPDSFLESRLQQFREEPGADESAETDHVDISSLWPEAANVVVDDEPESTLEFDPTVAVEAEADSEFISETLDAFPSTDSVEQIEAANESAAQSGPTFEPETQSDEEESVSVYMERLLARNRQVTGGSAASAEMSPVVAVAALDSEAAPGVVPGSDSANAAAKNPEKWLEDTPRHRQDRDQVRADVQVLRQIANQSARSAVATASRRDVRKQVIVKTTASMLSLVSGVAALLLDVSMLFGLVVLGIGMVFSVDLTLTIFRNWKQLRDLQRAAAALEREAGAGDKKDAPEAT